MPGIFDNILWGILLINFVITLMLMIGSSFWVTLTAPYYNQTFQVINSTGGLTTISGVGLNFTINAFPVNAMQAMQQFNETIITSLVPISQNATFINILGLSIPNPTNFVIILFNIFIIIWDFIYNWFYLTPHWIAAILYNIVTTGTGSVNPQYYINAVNTIATVYALFSSIAFFWFIINYVWQPLSWIVGFILGASQQFIQQILSRL